MEVGRKLGPRPDTAVKLAKIRAVLAENGGTVTVQDLVDAGMNENSARNLLDHYFHRLETPSRFLMEWADDPTERPRLIRKETGGISPEIAERQQARNREIRDLVASGKPRAVVAKRFGITVARVGQILSGK